MLSTGIKRIKTAFSQKSISKDNLQIKKTFETIFEQIKKNPIIFLKNRSKFISRFNLLIGTDLH